MSANLAEASFMVVQRYNELERLQKFVMARFDNYRSPSSKKHELLPQLDARRGMNSYHQVSNALRNPLEPSAFTQVGMETLSSANREWQFVPFNQ